MSRELGKCVEEMRLVRSCSLLKMSEGSMGILFFLCILGSFHKKKKKKKVVFFLIKASKDEGESKFL